MIVISPIERRLLLALAAFRLLTHSQMYRLQIAHSSYLRTLTHKLCSFPNPAYPLVGRLKKNRFGCMEHMFFLTGAGALFLGIVPDKKLWPCPPRHRESAYDDYWHRKYCVDFHIALVLALRQSDLAELEHIDRYYLSQAGSKNAAHHSVCAQSRIVFPEGQQFFVPDMNFLLQGKTNSSIRALYTLEMINGRNTKRVLQQVFRHTEAHEQGAFSARYGMQVSAVLLLFSSDQALEAVRRRFFEIRPDANRFAALFYFGTVARINRSVLACWKMAGKDAKQYFHFVTGKAV
ncbi:hypothetical protein SCOR_26215 [Sulfidibacter corallicola]|uniref:Uncharacterized protein n=1 Tax=Sulfidibacter corallicola TaxID=2818388 RepID=A0A8A4TQ67_SULCO|nr:hypothetical protein [Sulfidibacter corallicola]QTD52109.1 hypothetical protein J3U87_06510 [Sulfidibacter corallicola]